MRALVSAACIALLLGLSAGLIWFSVPVAVPAKADPPFVVATTSDRGGLLWLDVESDRPIYDGERVKMSFEISGPTGASVALALGGSFVGAHPNCDGLAIDTREETIAKGDVLWETLVKYAQRRPGTGMLDGASWRESVGRDYAEKWAKTQSVLVDHEITLAGSVEKTFRTTEGSEFGPYAVGTATLTCTFDRSAVIETVLYKDRVRAPDLVVAHADRTGEGLVEISTALKIRPTVASTTVDTTLGAAISSLDDGLVVSEYNAKWWQSGVEGDTAIMLTGGSAVVEPQYIAGLRAWSRLAAGVAVTLAIALATAVIGSGVARSRWGTK